MQGSGLQDPKWVLCLSGQQFRAPYSPYSFSCKEAGALLSVFPWQAPVAAAVQCCSMLQWDCWDSRAVLAQPYFTSEIFWSQQQQQKWGLSTRPLPARQARWGFCCWIPGNKVKPDCCFLLDKIYSKVQSRIL